MDLLPNAGTISHDQAVEKAHIEFEVIRIQQDKDYIYELDNELKKGNI